MTRTIWMVLALVVAGCGGSGPGTAIPDADRLNPFVLYPLAEGNVWSYDVDTGTGITTLAITRVVAATADRFEVSSNRSDPVIYERREGGLFRPAHRVWLLPARIAVGERWPSAAEMTAEVLSVDETVSTEAGTYEGCVKVRESGGRDQRTIDTTYCPGVGPTVVRSELIAELSGMAVVVEARLRGVLLDEGASDEE